MLPSRQECQLNVALASRRLARRRPAASHAKGIVEVAPDTNAAAQPPRLALDRRRLNRT